ncbi:MAG: hypothetical protein WCH37_09555 [Synechococcaceae cyanobacterium ELA182]
MDPRSNTRNIGNNSGDQPPSNPRRRRIAIALGDPAGIGLEVTLGALAAGAGPGSQEEVVLVGCRQWLLQSYRRLQGRGRLAAPLRGRRRPDRCPGFRQEERHLRRRP